MSLALIFQAGKLWMDVKALKFMLCFHQAPPPPPPPPPPPQHNHATWATSSGDLLMKGLNCPLPPCRCWAKIVTLYQANHGHMIAGPISRHVTAFWNLIEAFSVEGFGHQHLTHGSHLWIELLMCVSCSTFLLLILCHCNNLYTCGLVLLLCERGVKVR